MTGHHTSSVYFIFLCRISPSNSGSKVSIVLVSTVVHCWYFSDFTIIDLNWVGRQSDFRSSLFHKGWMKILLWHPIFSIDNCDNTGDHENFFNHSTDAYEIDGTKYTNCRKITVRYRSRVEHKLLSRLTTFVFLLYDGLHFTPVNYDQLSKKNGINPNYS